MLPHDFSDCVFLFVTIYSATMASTNRKKEILYIIDGNSYIYRAFYAVRGLSNSSGLPTNAIFGFANMLLKVIKDRKPDLLAIVFDPKGRTRRHSEYAEYKAHRPPMPSDLVPQIPYIHKLVEAFRIPVFIVEGEEADDVIATIARKAESDGIGITVVSGDKDLLQLVGTNITVYDSMKDKFFEPADVEERFGVHPDRVVEILGLMGDASDNIPGVPGIGEKTAQVLIRQFGTIENLISRSHEITKPKLRQSVADHAQLARLSRELAVLHTDIPLRLNYEDLKIKPPDTGVLLSMFKELQFTALLKHIAPDEQVPPANYHAILDKDELLHLAMRLAKAEEFSFDTETTSLDPLRAKLVGISFSLSPGEAFYLPLGHNYPHMPGQIPLDDALNVLKPLFLNPSIGKIGQNIKYDLLVLGRYRIEVSNVSFDTMIASYLLNPGKPSHGMDALALEYLNHRTITYNEVTGTGKKQISFDQVEIPAAVRYSGEDADITLRLKTTLEPLLKEHNLEKLFHEMEMPLIEVLVSMERIGVKIDAEVLSQLSKNACIEMNSIEQAIYELAGGTFNINSPKQLAVILFEKLQLTPIKKTKTGFSTDVDVLEGLAHVHPLPAEILKYRSLAKLKSTYMDALPVLINPETNRLHTSLNQAVTATGRLSSSDPNLQNIPIRTPIGRQIRRAFIAEQGSSLLSADYSQIELRILAHMSNDPALIRTFQLDEDIHTRTASEIFGLTPDEVTGEMRRKAKSVNFGIIYGISAYGLAQDIGVSNGEAKRYIENYFARYPDVRKFIDRTIEEAKSTGQVATLLGRRRFIPELASANASVRSFGERTAVNTPIQGTAADLIKLAMINIHRRLCREQLKTHMILQIHDELVFEVPDHEMNQVKKLVREEMEGVQSLAVPIKVDMGSGMNWDEAH